MNIIFNFLHAFIIFHPSSHLGFPFKLSPKIQTTLGEHRHDIPIVLEFLMSIWHVITIFVSLQQDAFHHHYSVITTMVTFTMKMEQQKFV
jgi:hypothetical protein